MKECDNMKKIKALTLIVLTFITIFPSVVSAVEKSDSNNPIASQPDITFQKSDINSKAATKEAIENGALDAKRLVSYHKMVSEQQDVWTKGSLIPKQSMVVKKRDHPIIAKRNIKIGMFSIPTTNIEEIEESPMPFKSLEIETKLHRTFCKESVY
ncbi:hypothetical protein [Bavariicoccus seileri]|uniref:hypothetical protein n=2 Tax=Bavariicoccus seileri TaxID=549685 RepID=UPI0003B4E64D|nr:hypothetical protein [Bavariicoccus seileri]